MYQYIISKRRNTGMWRAVAEQMAVAIKMGEKAALFSCQEKQYVIDRYINYFKTEHNIQVSYKRITRLEPSSNWRPVYDQFSEIVDIEIVEQKEIFSGWIMTLNNNL